jgi:hypothetical protein
MQGHAYPAMNEPQIFSTMRGGILDDDVIEVPILHRLYHTATVIDPGRSVAKSACHTHHACIVDRHRRAAVSSWTKNAAVSRYATRGRVKKPPENVAVWARPKQTIEQISSRATQPKFAVCDPQSS